MLFNSIEYIIFLPIVYGIYWMLRKSVKWQNVVLLLASYLFYAWWDWRFLGLLVGMSMFAYVCGYTIGKSEEVRGKSEEKSAEHSGGGVNISHSQRFWLIANIVVDVGILALFKYYNFFVGSFADLFGLQNSIHSLKIVLPLGISFFTFQAIAYVVDVYKRKIEPTNLVDCLLYIGFFPKLLAGPIERPTNLIPQIQRPRIFDYEMAADGMRQILWGAFKKMAVADSCAVFVNQVWLTYDTQTGSNLMLAAILYTIQIYGDFSGYSDMAIGSAKLFGFRFRDNFLFPYFSRNMNEFWRRWHISLNTWFVDYVYIPLGGSRDGKWKTIRNTMIIFLLSGLWHGANWTYIAWGAYHGILLVLLILLNRNTKFHEVVASDRLLPTLKEIVQMLFVFMLATIGWILFKAPSIADAWEYVSGMMQFGTLRASYRFFFPNYNLVYPTNIVIIIMFAVEWLQRKKQHGLQMDIKQWYIRYPIYAAIIGMILYFSSSSATFIYAQF